MLTILFKILSILGIVLLILLGVAVVVALLILFFPVFYKISGKKNTEELLVSARAGWLFGLLHLTYDYPEPGKLVIKLLFFTLYDSSVEKTEKADDAPAEEEKPSASAKSSTDEPSQAASKMALPAEAESSQPPRGTDGGEEKVPEPVEPEMTGKKEKTSAKTTNRLYGFFERIRYTVRMICAKIKNILENIAFYKELWNDPDTQGLLKHAGKRLGHILKRLRPRKLTVTAIVGTGSPDTTGYLYAIYGMLLPKLGKGICITPDFEQAVLEGDFKASGHFTVACVLFHSLRLLMDRRLQELRDKIREYKKTQKK